MASQPDDDDGPVTACVNGCDTETNGNDCGTGTSVNGCNTGKSVGEAGQMTEQIAEFEDFSEKLDKYVSQFDEVYGQVEIRDLEELHLTLDTERDFSEKLDNYVSQFDEMYGQVEIRDFEELHLTLDTEVSDTNQHCQETRDEVTDRRAAGKMLHSSLLSSGGSEMWRSTNGKTYECVWPPPKCLQISTHDECDINYFEFLPIELVIKIFSFFTTQELCKHVSTVCRKWRQLSLDQTLWKSLDFSASPNISSLNFLWIIRRAPLLQRLNLSGRSDIKRAEVAIFTECCPGLVEIDFGFCDNLTADMIKSVSENCKGLRKLNVEGCEKLEQRAIRYVARCRKLTSINFSHCILQDAAVKYLADKLTYITCLNLDGIADLTDNAVIRLVSKHSDHLLELELDGAEISDISMEHISRCQNLRLLGLSFCECLTDQALVFLQTLKHLETLRLRKGSDLTAAGLTTFFQEASLTGLQSLNLTECSHINDATVLQIAKACGRSLRELSLGWCWFVTDTGLISIVDHCCRLENLDLLGIDKIQGLCLARIPDEMPHLKMLDLRQCNRIHDDLIRDVIRRKNDLKGFNYYGEEFIYFE